MPAPHPELETRNHRILVVDDNPSIHEDFRRILSPSDFGQSDLDAAEAIIFGDKSATSARVDYQLAFASQGEEAVAIARSAMEQGIPFAAAVVDVRMPPGMDGVQTIKKLWQVQRDLEIVICTAYSEYSWDEIIAELGPSHRVIILKKPFDPIEVLQLAQALTSKWGVEREAAFRQLELQGRLLQGSERLVEACERLRVEQERRVRLEKSMREIQRTDSLARLAVGIAHDFNNLLTVIQGHLSLAMEDSHSSTKINDALENVLGAARRATDLSRQLLSFSKETDGRTRPVDLTAHIQRDLPVLERSLGEVFKIDLDGSPGLPTVLAEPCALSHLIANLVLHARDAMPHGGHITISTRAVVIESAAQAAAIHDDASPGQYVTLAVRDTGRGLSARALQQVFEPAGDSAPHHGLPVVRSLAREWGGWAAATSVEGVGTTITVFLPIVHAPAAVPADGSPVDTLVDDVGTSCILVVDDDPTVRELVVYLLKRNGHEVLSAGDADQAWRLWMENRRRIHLLVADVNLPGAANGFDLATAINQEDSTLPVIFMSASCPDMLSSPRQLVIGVDFIPKPFDVLDLMNAVSMQLTRGMGHTLLPKSQEMRPPALAAQAV